MAKDMTKEQMQAETKASLNAATALVWVGLVVGLVFNFWLVFFMGIVGLFHTAHQAAMRLDRLERNHAKSDKEDADGD